MKYLLDSNIFIFLLQENFESISQKQYEILNNSTNKLLLPVLSSDEYFPSCKGLTTIK